VQVVSLMLKCLLMVKSWFQRICSACIDISMQMTEWAKVTLSQGNFSPVIKPKIYNIHEPSFDIRFVGVSKGKWTPGFGKINKLKNTFTFPVDVFERKKRAKVTPFYGTKVYNFL